MNIYLQLKLIARSWWRNRLFFLISLFSLTVGLGCTNLLMTFFIHEYNVEKENPDRECIYMLRQDNPMKEGSKTLFASPQATDQIRAKYAEVASVLCVRGVSVTVCQLDGQKVQKPQFVEADSTLNDIFPYTVVAGSLREALTVPGKVALSEAYAGKVFGKENPIGKTLEMVINNGNDRKHFQVAAVLKERTQSFLQFDIVAGIHGNNWGGSTLLKLQPGSSHEALQAKMQEDKIQTLTGEGHYDVVPLQDVYFYDGSAGKQQQYAFFRQSDASLLYIGLASALLVLVIACFNYTNLNLSRTLQQLKMVHIEKLMGARLKEIRTQLFLDATCMVLIAFALSLLLINDVLVGFNHLFSSKLTWSFLFSGQVLPWLLAFALVLAVTPALYISHRLSGMSLSEYRKNYTGRQKQRLVGLLVMLQFVFSIGLVYAATVAQSQMALTEARAHRYEHTIEIGEMYGPQLAPYFQEAKQVQGIELMTLTMGSVMNGWVRELPVKHADGTESRHYMMFIPTDTTFLKIMNIRQLAGLPPMQAGEEYGMPVFISEQYAQWIGADETSIGHKLNEFDTMADTLSIVAGIIENFPTNSLEEEVAAQMLLLMTQHNLEQVAMYMVLRLRPESRQETLAKLEEVWQKVNPGKEFVYTDMHEVFLKRNQKITTLSGILMTYSLIALALTCFGLFGISWYAVRQRTREIAIRKVHGASTIQIVWMLNRSFFAQIVVAYIVAMPIGWWLMQHWLESFVYRADLGLWNFIAPLLVVFVIALITVTLHSWHAAQSNPVDSLKTE